MHCRLCVSIVDATCIAKPAKPNLVAALLSEKECRVSWQRARSEMKKETDGSGDSSIRPNFASGGILGMFLHS